MNADNLLAVTANISGLGILGNLNISVESTTEASGGAAGAVPASAGGYLFVTVSGRSVRIPYYES